MRTLDEHDDIMRRISTTCIVQKTPLISASYSSTKQHLESYGVEDTGTTNLRAGLSFEGSDFNADRVFAAQQPDRRLYSPRRLFEPPLLTSESVLLA